MFSQWGAPKPAAGQGLGAASSAAYPPATKFSALPQTEQAKYQNKDRHFEKNKEKIEVIKGRSLSLLEGLSSRLSAARQRHFRLLGELQMHCSQHDALKHDDRVAWSATEELGRFCEQLQKEELPPIETAFSFGQHLLQKLEAVLGELEEHSTQVSSMLSHQRGEAVTQKMVSNILHAQQEAYNAVLQKHLDLAEQLSEQKERYRQKRRDGYSDYSEPFTS